MRNLILLSILVASSALAQTPNALVQYSDPPEANGASYITYPRHLLWNTTLQCAQRSTATGWQCLTTAAETSAAVSSAVSQAATAAAAIYMPTSTANAAISALQTSATSLGARVTSLETTTVTQAGQISAATTTANAAATQSSLTSSVAALNTRIDGVQSSIKPDTVCANATVTGLSIPLTGISTTTNITVPGAIAGYPCVVGNPSFLPLGAKGVCIASAADSVQMRFEAGGLLSSLISIPNGTYRACVLVRP